MKILQVLNSADAKKLVIWEVSNFAVYLQNLAPLEISTIKVVVVVDEDGDWDKLGNLKELSALVLAEYIQFCYNP